VMRKREGQHTKGVRRNITEGGRGKKLQVSKGGSAYVSVKINLYRSKKKLSRGTGDSKDGQ